MLEKYLMFCSFRRGEQAKTNFPISDYEAELEHLRTADYDALVADLRTEVNLPLLGQHEEGTRKPQPDAKKAELCRKHWAMHQ